MDAQRLAFEYHGDALRAAYKIQDSIKAFIDNMDRHNADDCERDRCKELYDLGVVMESAMSFIHQHNVNLEILHQSRGGSRAHIVPSPVIWQE